MPKPSASMWRWNPAKAAGIAWGRGGRPTSKVIRETVEREREEARERAQKRIDERKAITQARYKQEKINVERYHAGLPRVTGDPAERTAEAQATIREAQAVEAQAEAVRIDERENWVSEFTPQQRHEISTFETAKGRVRSDIGVGLNEIEGIRMIQELDRKIGSYQKVRRPRSSSDPPIYPEEQGVGMTWPDPNGSGALLGRKPDGTQFTAVKPGDTLQGIQLKEQMAIAAEQRTRFKKWEDEREKYARELQKEGKEVPGKSGIFGTADSTIRLYTPTELKTKVAEIFGAAPSWAQAEAPQQRQLIEAEPDEILHAREVIKAPGMGLRNVEAAERLIEEWESREGGTTETEYRRMPSRARFIDPEGRERIKP